MALDVWFMLREKKIHFKFAQIVSSGNEKSCVYSIIINAFAHQTKTKNAFSYEEMESKWLNERERNKRTKEQTKMRQNRKEFSFPFSAICA